MVAIVTLVFAICWLPITLYIMSASVFQHRTPLIYYFKILANSFAYLNSAINPILYAFLNRSFRNNCGSLLTERSCSIFCQRDFRPRRVAHQRPSHNRLSSTQIDRFSYQSTNCQSGSSIFFSKKKKPLIVITATNRLSTDMTSPNDFSDMDYEISNTDRRSSQNSRVLSIEDKNRSNTLTTSFWYLFEE